MVDFRGSRTAGIKKNLQLNLKISLIIIDFLKGINIAMSLEMGFMEPFKKSILKKSRNFVMGKFCFVFIHQEYEVNRRNLNVKKFHL